MKYSPTKGNLRIKTHLNIILGMFFYENISIFMCHKPARSPISQKIYIYYRSKGQKIRKRLRRESR